MINTVTVTNHLGESITMDLRDPASSGFLVRYIDGLGPPKADVQITEMSLMDGAFYNSARAQSRNIVFSLGFYLAPSDVRATLPVIPVSPPSISGISGGEITTTEVIIEDLRQKTYKYFPLKKRIKIVIETDRRTCEVYGYVESNTPDVFSKDTGTVISVICPYSYLLSTEVSLTEFASIEPVFEFPFGNESTSQALLEFSQISGYFTRTIYYPGDVEVGMIMHIHAVGDVENVEIFKIEPEPIESIKIDTERLLVLTGEGFHNGDDIVISTVKGSKYATLIRDGVETNILSCLDKYPDWLQLTQGDNIFTYTADTGELSLQFKIENQVAYEGI